MQDTTYLVSLLKSSFQLENNNLRKLNAKILNEFMHTQPQIFLEQSIAENFHINSDTSTRFLLMTNLKSSLKMEAGVIPNLWAKQNSGTRLDVQHAALIIMTDCTKQIRKCAAQLVALTIILEQFSDNDQTQLILRICENTNHSTVNIRVTALEALNSLCEIFGSNKAKNISETVQQCIIDSIFNSINEFSDDYNLSLTALVNSFFFMHKHFHKNGFLNFLLEKIFCIFKKGKLNSDIAFIFLVINAYCELVKIAYLFLQKYLSLIFDSLIECLVLDDTKLNTAIFGFFSKCFRIEFKHKKNYLQDYWVSLVHLSISQLIQFTNAQYKSPQIDSDFLEIIGDFLADINRCYTLSSILLITQQATAFLDSSEPGYNSIGLILLDSLLENSPTHLILSYLLPKIIALVEILNDSSGYLHKTIACQLIIKIAEFHLDLIVNIQHFKPVLFSLFSALKTQSNFPEHLRVQIFISKIITKITENSIKNAHCHVLIKAYSFNLSEVLFCSLEQCQDKNFIEAIYEALFSIADNVLEGHYLTDFVKILIQKLYETENKTVDYLQNQKIINLLTLINFSLMKIQQTCPNNLIQDFESILYFQNIIELQIKKQSAYKLSGIQLISTIMLGFPETFFPLVLNFFEMHLNFFLESYNDMEMSIRCINIFSQLFGQFAEILKCKLSKFLPGILSLLFEIESNPDLTITVVSFMSFLFIHSGKDITFYLIDWLKTWLTVFNQTIICMNKNDENQEYFVQSISVLKILLENLLVVFHCFYISFHNFEKLIEDFMIEFQESLEGFLNRSYQIDESLYYDLLTSYAEFYSKNRNNAKINWKNLKIIIWNVQKMPMSAEIANKIKLFGEIVLKKNK